MFKMSCNWIMSKPSFIDPAAVRLVKASIPFLVNRGEELTRCFYGRLFKGNPEVLALFNQAHQHSGSQQRALAGAICAYAQHIDDPGKLSGAVALIAQKHVSLGVKPEHYSIVGKHLLAAIGELLGESASPELIDAWGKAYAFLAGVFIQREKEDYAAQAKNQGGWNGRRTFRVKRKNVESAEVMSFHLEPEDDGGLPSFLPGQYITLYPSEGNPSSSPRNYSLSHRPDRKSWRISVKRQHGTSAHLPEGLVSSFLHDEIHPGDRVELGPPCGVFHLTPEDCAGKSIVLLSAGVGQTPLLSMLHSLAKTRTAARVIYIHVARNGRHHAFREEVADLQKNWFELVVRILYTRPDARDLKSNRPYATGLLRESLWAEAQGDPRAEYYFCGPKRFMRDVRILLNQCGVSSDRQHCEFFGPAENLEATS